MSGQLPVSATGWWRDESIMHRFVHHLLAAEMAALRPTSACTPGSWDASLHLTRDLGVDSLELVALASALAETIHLHESGIEDRLLVRPTVGEWATIAQDGLEAFSSTMTFRTSGSTGNPKPCVHTLAALWQEVIELAPRFTGRTRVVSAVRSHHIYGFLFTVLLPRALGLSPSAYIDVRGRIPSSVLAELRAGDLVIGYPDFWQVLATPASGLPHGIVGVTSTAPCPAEVARDLSAAGLDSLVQLYGSTETAGVGVRSDPDESYSLLSFWERGPGDDGALVRVFADGHRQSILLQDSLDWTGDRQFRPTGRLDHALQVAGINVFPANVRRVLMEHPDVHDAVVRRMTTSELGRLKAFIVPRAGRPGDMALHTELEAWVSTRLSAPERPRAFSFGESLPRDASGKPADWRMEPVDRSRALPPGPASALIE